MKKFTAALAGVTLFTAVAAPLAAAASYPDLSESHWAYQDMDRAKSLGILSGVPGGGMDPSGVLTWGQYLTMLGRTFYRADYEAAPAGTSWDHQGYYAAVQEGLLTGSAAQSVRLDTLNQPINRQEAAQLLYQLMPQEESGYDDWDYGWGWGGSSRQAETDLTDWYSIPQEYQPAVKALYEARIINGTADGSFNGEKELARADGTVMLMGVLEKVDEEHQGETIQVTIHPVNASGNPIQAAYTAQVRVGQSYSSLDEIYGYDYDDEYFYTFSSVSTDATIQYRKLSGAELAMQEADRKLQEGTMTLEEYYAQDFWLALPGENDRKLQLLFGDSAIRRFADQATAKTHMTTITVPVWKISNGKKVSSTFSFSIHAAIAEDVKEIFTEIYNDPEQFPMHDLGGYSWRGDTATGEHNCGTAIDINANENYQIRDGQVLVGSLWQPGSNPYSISPDGSVVRIFEEHGWSWGGDAWAYDSDASSGYHDYMHFSYMGM
ncbi:MAG TPA: S-layer homology domain-containing protein [Candidatus Flavonifractor merdigallinarum]|uniref:S-layer homology domain-containing protein n=1 Tax=Candidatus Flavonifractor merdigallinarum TaxID=2838589 RepID=A0A9D1Y755_9FIRM|nr:S-layer homology domain-containing protein [Candidatus Flavonifractor merdigallinarum]